MIHVSCGSGWICDKGREAGRIKAGDVMGAPLAPLTATAPMTALLRFLLWVLARPNGMSKLPMRNTKGEGKIDCRGLSPETEPLDRSSAVDPPTQEKMSTNQSIM